MLKPKLLTRRTAEIGTTTALLVAIPVLVVGVAAGVYFIFFHITKSDYARVAKKSANLVLLYNTLEDTSDKHSKATWKDGITDEALEQMAGAYKDADQAYRNATIDLSHERALKNTDIKRTYEVFDTKNQIYIHNKTSMYEARSQVRQVALLCSPENITGYHLGDSKYSIDDYDYDSGLGKCASAVKKLSTTKNPDLIKLGVESAEYFDGMREAYMKLDETHSQREMNIYLDSYSNNLAKLAKIFNFQKIHESQSALSPAAELNSLAQVASSLSK